MGVLNGPLLLPLAPVQGVARLSNVLLDAAERESYDPAVLRARPAAPTRAHDDGDIDTETFERDEERLLDLLDQYPQARHTAQYPRGAR